MGFVGRRAAAGRPAIGALSLWTGTTVNAGPVETWGDYGRACSVDGDIGLIPIGERQGLVLGDQPAETTYLPAERLFLRWVAADEEVVWMVLVQLFPRT